MNRFFSGRTEGHGEVLGVPGQSVAKRRFKGLLIILRHRTRLTYNIAVVQWLRVQITMLHDGRALRIDFPIETPGIEAKNGIRALGK